MKEEYNDKQSNVFVVYMKWKKVEMSTTKYKQKVMRLG